MALATNSTPGSIILAGDLTGNANAPSLRASGVVPGSYTTADIVVDAKGRIIHATSGNIVLNGDVTGTMLASVLSDTAVTAGTYTFTGVTVDSKGRITAASSGSAPTLAGDVSGALGATVLANTAVTPGSYTFADVTIDSKGRITAAANGTVTLAGDVTGVPGTTVLSNTAVVAGAYASSSLTVDGKGRITAAEDTVFSGDINGAVTSNYLSNTGVTANSYTLASFTVDAKGRLTAASTGSLTLAGDVTGVPGTTVLSDTGIVAGAYTEADVTVDSKGRITAVTANAVIPDASYADKGYLQVTSGTGLVLSSGVLSGAASSSTTTYGRVRSGNTNNISIVAGDVDVGTNIPLLNDSRVFGSHIREAYQLTSNPATPDLSSYNIFSLTNSATDVVVNAAANGQDGDCFRFVCFKGPKLSTRTFPAASGGYWASVAWNGTVFCAVYGGTGSSTVAATSTDGVTWTARTLPVSTTWRRIVWNGTVFCAVGGIYSATSSDGVTWTLGTSITPPYYFTDVAWNGTVFYAAVNAAVYGFTSTDGLSWTEGSTSVAPDGTVIWNGSTFIGMHSGSGSGVGKSTDGVTWTWSSIGAGVDWASPIAWNGTVFCAVSANNGYIATSSDGVTWSVTTPSVLPSTSRIKVINIGSTFYLLGSGWLAMSGDGVSWTTIPPNIANATDIYWSGSMMVVLDLTRGYTGLVINVSFNAAYKFNNTAPAAGYFMADCVYKDSTAYCSYSQ